jgi:MarR family 2-MHQ and catechol resistance regulon transcriptional repressor
MATKHRGAAREVRALNAYIALLRAGETATARIHRHLAGSGLTISQFGALEALYHLGPMRQHELAQKLLRSPGNMTTVLDNLEKRRLVKRTRVDADRRCTTIVLTGAGKRLVARIFPRHVERVVEELGALSQKEQDDLSRLCRKLGLGRGA